MCLSGSWYGFSRPQASSTRSALSIGGAQRLLRRPKLDAKAEEYGTASDGKVEMSQWASVRAAMDPNA